MKRRLTNSWTRSSRPRAALLAALVIGGAMVVLSLPSSALTNSSFEETDGNLQVDGTSPPALDWANVGINCVTHTGCAVDKPTGQTDDSFGQGTSENDPVPSVTDGSIPNQKSDLTRFYVATTKENGKDFVHLAWERVQDPTGTTNMDFEFNQSQTLSSNGVTPERTVGDLLIKYDLAQGGTTPVLGRHTWVNSGKASDVCEAGNKLPCWGKVVPLAAAVANGSLNTGDVVDPINPDAPRTLGARTFGEASINLTDIGLFPPGQCVNFGSGYLKSRSADSFTAAIKDFVAPVTVSVSNCGGINVHKQDDAGNPLPGAMFTLFNDNAPTGGTAPHGIEDTAVVPATTCTTNASGNCSMSNVLFGQYWVVETTTPPGYTTADDKNVVLTASSTPVSLVFVDPRRPASVKLHKQDDAGAPLANATFTLYVNNAPTAAPRGNEDTMTGFTCTTASNGDCTISGILPAGSYWVVETTTPPGYTTAADRAVVLALGQNLDITGTPFVDPRQPASVKLHKQDDVGAPLANATFTLYVNNAPTAAPRGNEDTITGFTCTTGSNGDCTISGILPPGSYWVVETTTPPGYTTAADRAVVLALGQNLDITGIPFVDVRLFKVIVLVCNESNGTLHPSSVTIDGDNKTSLASSSVPDSVCSTGGAAYGGKTAGNHPGNVSIP